MTLRIRTSLLADPILHFAVIGVGLFALHAWLAPAAPADDAHRIVVAADRVQGLIDGWKQAWARPPTPAELDQMIEEEIRSEVFSREAKALGLDRDDEFIRQHLRERMEVIADNSAGAVEPSESELEAFYRAHQERFGGGTILSFLQVPLDPARRGADLDRDAAALLEELRRSGPETDLAALGDLPDLTRDYGGVPPDELASLFGEEFTQALLKLPLGEWSGPIASAYGVHLVKLKERGEQPAPPFAEIKDMVRDEWLADRTQVLRERTYRAMRERYEVTVERPSGVVAAIQPAEAAGR